MHARGSIATLAEVERLIEPLIYELQLLFRQHNFECFPEIFEAVSPQTGAIIGLPLMQEVTMVWNGLPDWKTYTFAAL